MAGLFQRPNRKVVRKDTKDFSGKGKYTPVPGRGPYDWRSANQTPDGIGDGGWTDAPAESHLLRFRLVYTLSEWDTQRTEYGTRQVKTKDDSAILQIEFRDGKAYDYYAETEERAKRLETIFHLMESAEHPGQIIWSHLTLEKFPYAPR